MSLSLQEQLLKAGLVSEKKARQAELEQRQQQHQQRKQPPAKTQRKQVDLRPPAPSAAQLAQRARDQELNKQRQEKAARKARNAEIRQLVEQHRLPRIDSEEYFNFIHGKKIHRMAVDAERRTRLQSGALIIVRHAPGYAVVSSEIAARIAERDATYVVDLNAPDNAASAADEGDYKDFVVPDDLMW